MTAGRIILLPVLVLAIGAAAVGYQIERKRQQQIHEAESMTGGNVDRGRLALVRFGCAGCHQIPGMREARGQVGPPLQGLSDRLYVGGLPNQAYTLIAWVQNPTVVAARPSPMPATGIGPSEARDAVAYLYAH